MTSNLPKIPADSPIIMAIRTRPQEFVSSVLAAGVESVPLRGDVPAGYFDSELAPFVMSGISVAVAALTEGRRLSNAEVSAFVTPIVERHAADGIPLPFLFTSLHGGIRRLWEFVSEHVADADTASLAALGVHLADLCGTASTMMTEVYQDSDFAPKSGREQLVQLCKSLVAGDPSVGAFARDAGIALSDHYDVLAILVDTTQNPQSVHDHLTARRRMRYGQQVFYEYGPNLALNTFDGGRGIVLLPSPLTASSDTANLVHVDVELVTALSERLEMPIYASVRQSVELSAIPAAVEEATEIACLARQLRRGAGVYRLDDVLLEYQVARSGRARDLLVERVAPLEQHPALLDALHAHLRHGSDRKSAAAELFVHPNTLTYRLRKIHELTGVDPTDPYGSRVLAAALTAQAISAETPSD